MNPMRWSLLSVLSAGAVIFGLAGCDRAGGSANAAQVDSTKAATEDTDTSAMPAGPAGGAQRHTGPSPRKAPAQNRRIYLNAYGAGSKARLPKLIAIADSTEINAFVVDVKDEKGVHYRTQIALAKQLSLPGEVTLSNLKAFVDTLHAHGIYAIGRVVVFKDPILSKAKPDWSIKNPSGALWMDKAGNTWVSAWDPNVWEYNIQIAEEVLKAGFDEIQFDYVRFPEPFP